MYMINHDMNLGSIQNNQVLSVKSCYISFISPYLKRWWKEKYLIGYVVNEQTAHNHYVSYFHFGELS